MIKKIQYTQLADNVILMLLVYVVSDKVSIIVLYDRIMTQMCFLHIAVFNKM